jgi:hypothetical protein
LTPHYPAISNVRLTDYKVRVLDSGKGTAAKVRVDKDETIEKVMEDYCWGV